MIEDKEYAQNKKRRHFLLGATAIIVIFLLF